MDCVIVDRTEIVGQERVVAVGLLSERELAFVGQNLRRVYRIDESGNFDDLLRAIDAAESLRAIPHTKARPFPGVA